MCAERRGERLRTLEVLPDFDFRATVWSHGWCVLAPFRWEPETGVLERPLRLRSGVVNLSLSQPNGRGAPVEMAVAGGRGSRSGLAEGLWAGVERDVARMLQIDRDLAGFHAACLEAGSPFDRAPEQGFGRLLRSPTVFEDVVKVLATTNTAWSGTKAMVANLVRLTKAPAFPTASEVADLGAGRLRTEGRWGYRAEYLAALAQLITDGELDLEAWDLWEGTTEDLAAEIHRVPGLGPYSTASLLGLLGRFDRIAVDSVFRSFVRRRYFPKARKSPTDRRMEKVYARWREWRGLAYWYDVWSSDYEDADALESSASK